MRELPGNVTRQKLGTTVAASALDSSSQSLNQAQRAPGLQTGGGVRAETVSLFAA
jgi:hypothetical protein